MNINIIHMTQNINPWYFRGKLQNNFISVILFKKLLYVLSFFDIIILLNFQLIPTFAIFGFNGDCSICMAFYHVCYKISILSYLENLLMRG